MLGPATAPSLTMELEMNQGTGGIVHLNFFDEFRPGF